MSRISPISQDNDHFSSEHFKYCLYVEPFSSPDIFVAVMPGPDMATRCFRLPNLVNWPLFSCDDVLRGSNATLTPTYSSFFFPCFTQDCEHHEEFVFCSFNFIDYLGLLLPGRSGVGASCCCSFCSCSSFREASR